MNQSVPVVMCVAELDPTGGGGIAADIETLCSLGCHCTPIMSAISIQDTLDVKDSAVVDSTLLIEQMRAVLEDMVVSAVKLHQLASTAHVESIHTVLTDYRQLRVVVDPALWSLPVEPDFCDAMSTLILPQSELLLVTEEEAYEFAQGADNLQACAHQLLDMGCGNVLISRHNSGGANYCSHLYSRAGLQQQFEWQSLPHNFVGAGSTFAAAITAFLAHGATLPEAIRQAQEYTWLALSNARRLGLGRLIPNRLRPPET
jgi:hydroxymethylpyrimidine/phosphomethylpyrimidine kinase